MKQVFAALLALCLLASLAGLAEEPVVVDDNVEIAFALADFCQDWEAVTGEAPRSAGGMRLAETPVPGTTPEELALLKDIFAQAGRWIGNEPEDEPIPEGKLVFAVYAESQPDEPVTSYRYGVLFGDIPAQRLAESQDEADAVLVFWPEYEHAGSYGIGNGYRCFTKLGVYDMKAGRVLYTRTALVNEPPSKVSDNENHYGRFDPYGVIRLIGERLATEQQS